VFIVHVCIVDTGLGVRSLKRHLMKHKLIDDPASAVPITMHAGDIFASVERKETATQTIHIHADNDEKTSTERISESESKQKQSKKRHSSKAKNRKEKQMQKAVPLLVVATHVHFDHSGGLHEFGNVAIHTLEARALQEGSKYYSVCFVFDGHFEQNLN